MLSSALSSSKFHILFPLYQPAKVYHGNIGSLAGSSTLSQYPITCV